MHALRILAAALVIAASAPAIAQDVGVAAAVNQSASGTRPNAAIRTIGLGDNVIYNERIDTNADGLVQLLLADGTTFTVGPNSSLVIDSFVYDPAAGTAQVAATLTKGVLRFIGAATSKTPDGVAITTPVGVVGIRGGVTDINMNPPNGIPPHISMIFGNTVTLTQGGTLIGRLFEAGFSLAVNGGSIDTVRTPAEWASLIQQALSSNPGQNGGTQNPPTNTNVVESNIAEVNSGEPPIPPIPRDPIDRTGDLGDDLVADLPNVPNQPDQHQPPGVTFNGYSAGLVFVTNSADPPVSEAYPLISISTGFTTEFTNIAFDANGDPVSGELLMIQLSGDCGVACALRVKIDPTTSTIGIVDPNFAFINWPVTADLKSNGEVTLPPGVSYCDCDFLRWGFWDLSGTVTDPQTGLPFSINVTNGTWVVADDVTTAGELDGLAGTLANTTATFDGHAVGTYSDSDLGIGPTLTAGDMQMDWSFGTRTGTVEITDFGNRDLQGDLVGAPGFPGFIGDLNDGMAADGIIKGQFVNDGPGIADGVMGDFFVGDDSWIATGIFMGER